jgi:SAM-dependent methyltransferase
VPSAGAGQQAGFKDLFSGGAAAYARFRPRYPAALFDWLAAVSPARTLAVDVGTGNGQAAVALAGHFERVIGVEPGAGQLDHALPHERVEYRQAAAEALGLPDGCADLVLAAQAFHWFDAGRFFAEAARVLRPAGVLALATYGNCRVEPGVDAVINHLYADVLGTCWEPERRLVERGYDHVQAPFGPAAPAELAHPQFELRADLLCDELLGYIGTWSALGRLRKETGRDGVAEIADKLRAAFSRAAAAVGADRLAVVWPLTVRAWPRPD